MKDASHIIRIGILKMHQIEPHVSEIMLESFILNPELSKDFNNGNHSSVPGNN